MTWEVVMHYSNNVCVLYSPTVFVGLTMDFDDARRTLAQLMHQVCVNGFPIRDRMYRKANGYAVLSAFKTHSPSGEDVWYSLRQSSKRAKMAKWML